MTIKAKVIRNVAHDSWRRSALTVKLMSELCTATLVAVFPNLDQDLKVEVSTLFTNDVEIAEYNRLYRNKNTSTNVLSFPTIDVTKASDMLNHISSAHGYFCLGDIVFSRETIYRESIEQGKKMPHHIMHLFVHSILHLLGFDHETEDERIEMENIECSILANFGVYNLYE